MALAYQPFKRLHHESADPGHAPHRLDEKANVPLLNTLSLRLPAQAHAPVDRLPIDFDF